MRVLVAEHEPVLADFIAEGLWRLAMAVDVVQDGLSASDKLVGGQYDVVVLDRDLPGKHGDDVCRELVAEGVRARILMLTAIGDGRTGADDYLAKPFDFDELVARIDALGRRARPVVPPVLRRGGIELDTALRQVTQNGRFVSLSIKEFGVLYALMAADGVVVSAEDLLVGLRDEDADPFTNAVRVTISRLRAKLDDPQVIETVAGAGYRCG